MKRANNDSDIYSEVDEVVEVTENRCYGATESPVTMELTENRCYEMTMELTENRCYGKTDSPVTMKLTENRPHGMRKSPVTMELTEKTPHEVTASPVTTELTENRSHGTTKSPVTMELTENRSHGVANYPRIENRCYEIIEPAVIPKNSCVGMTKSTVIVKGKKFLKKLIAVVFILLAALLLSTVSACIAFTVKVFQTQSEIAALEQNVGFQLRQHQGLVDMLLRNWTQRYDSLQNNFDVLQEQSIQNFSESMGSIQRQNASVFMFSQLFSSIIDRTHLLELYNVTSCASLPPSSPSGNYWIRASNGSAVQVYCDMIRSCGGVTGGWTRVAELDMRNSDHQCPSDLRERTISGIRTCTINSSSSFVCSAVIIPTISEYSEVCGKIIAYQLGATEAFRIDSIDDIYVDGVSLTHGRPREHIWSFASALDEIGSIPRFNCPCTNINQADRTTSPPSFVGNDYFCDTATGRRFVHSRFYPDDALWDGAGCGPLSTCCSFNNPPWFYKQLPQPTTDSIELRLCRLDSSVNQVDVLIESIEMFVR